MNRTGDQTCFLFSCRDRGLVSNLAQAYSKTSQCRGTGIESLQRLAPELPLPLDRVR